jgi:hypothetical protein
MKKLIYILSAFVLGTSIASAKPVNAATAQKVAENFYKQNAKAAFVSSTLIYTEVDAGGLPVFYAFDINNHNGFVIVAAEDAAHPIIGYSTENSFVMPKPTENTNIGYWLKSCARGINMMRSKGRVANTEAALQWQKYIKNKPELYTSARLTGNNATASANPVVGPLCQTTWNQSPLYNAMCPGASNAKAVTGCVATAMAQIMRYWSYPTTGRGSSTYCDCMADGYSDNYGIQSANYGATTYSWSAMPYNVTTPNTAVATLMYHCGVSVEMDYDPSGSGAWVIAGDDSVCAQNAYVTYFKYNPNTIQGLYRSNYSESDWLTLIENDLNLGRPVQYVGDDPTEGGHTWVCDGYDQNNYLHMNWGWGGYANGWFQVDSLTTPGFDPSEGHEVLIGIVPVISATVDAGIPEITEPVGYYCGVNTFVPAIKLENYGSSTLTSCVINYQVDGGAVQTQNWSGSLVSFQSTTVNLPSMTLASGTHTLTCYSSNPNDSTDQNSANDQSVVTINVTNSAALPVIEGFETTTSLPNAIWNVSHTATMGGVDFAVTSAAAATGMKSCMIDNMNNVGGNNSVIETISFYDLTTLPSPALTFKAAYQQKTTANADRLQVAVSTDCGANWLSKRVITGAALAALGGVGSSAYVPTPAEFTTYAVNIISVANSTDIMFRWEFYADPNGPGNNLYIDDINIINAPATSGIRQIADIGNELTVYPNPAKDIITIEGLTENKTTAITLSDMLGREIYSQTTTSANCVIDVSGLNSGVYLVNMLIEGQHVSKKVVVQ